MNPLSIAQLSNIRRPLSRKHVLIYFAALACLALPLSTSGALRRFPGVRSSRLVQNKNGAETVYHVVLDRRFELDELDTLAREIRRRAPQAQAIMILYFLRGMKPDQGAWATSKFNPSLDAFEIQINEAAAATNPPDADLQVNTKRNDAVH
jgi:hypothetical protein